MLNRWSRWTVRTTTHLTSLPSILYCLLGLEIDSWSAESSTVYKVSAIADLQYTQIEQFWLGQLFMICQTSGSGVQIVLGCPHPDPMCHIHTSKYTGCGPCAKNQIARRLSSLTTACVCKAASRIPGHTVCLIKMELIWPCGHHVHVYSYLAWTSVLWSSCAQMCVPCGPGVGTSGYVQLPPTVQTHANLARCFLVIFPECELFSFLAAVGRFCQGVTPTPLQMRHGQPHEMNEERK